MSVASGRRETYTLLDRVRQPDGDRCLQDDHNGASHWRNRRQHNTSKTSKATPSMHVLKRYRSGFKLVRPVLSLRLRRNPQDHHVLNN